MGSVLGDVMREGWGDDETFAGLRDPPEPLIGPILRYIHDSINININSFNINACYIYDRRY